MFINLKLSSDSVAVVIPLKVNRVNPEPKSIVLVPAKFAVSAEQHSDWKEFLILVQRKVKFTSNNDEELVQI